MIEKEKHLSDTLNEIVLNFEDDIKKYLKSFDMNDMLSINSNDEIRKKHLRNYNKFSVSLKKRIESFEVTVSMLSSLICEADNTCDKELTKKLINKFDNYSVFFVSVKKFINNCETVFLDKDSLFRPSIVMGYTRELLSATENYKNSL